MGTLPLLLVALSLGAEPLDPCVGVDDDGSQFRTCFEPGSGVELGFGAIRRTQFEPEFSFGLNFRTERDSRSREATKWFNEHRFVNARTEPAAGVSVVTAYQGNFRRHLKDGYVLIPTSPAFRLPFPFDVAIAVQGFRWERRVGEGPGAVIDTGRAALLLDPVRSETGRVRFSAGPALSHALILDGTNISQEISPLTSVAVDLGLESEDGLWSARLQGQGGFFFEPGQPSVTRGRLELQVDRVLIALDDVPLMLRLYGAVRHRDVGVSRGSEWAAGARIVLKAFGE